jgi:hypothetical protein
VIDQNRNFELLNRIFGSIADTEYSVSAEYSVPIAEYHRIAAFYTKKLSVLIILWVSSGYRQSLSLSA